jgi:hypothetical protein
MPDESVKPIIFLAFANDRDDRARYLRNLAEEARRLREALAPAERAGLCQVVVRQNATVREIFDVFQDAQTRNRVAVFHYGGHADSYRLLFEDAAGEPATRPGCNWPSSTAAPPKARRRGCWTPAWRLRSPPARRSTTGSQRVSSPPASAPALTGGASIGTAFGEAQAALRTDKVVSRATSVRSRKDLEFAIQGAKEGNRRAALTILRQPGTAHPAGQPADDGQRRMGKCIAYEHQER